MDVNEIYERIEDYVDDIEPDWMKNILRGGMTGVGILSGWTEDDVDKFNGTVYKPSEECVTLSKKSSTRHPWGPGWRKENIEYAAGAFIGALGSALTFFVPSFAIAAADCANAYQQRETEEEKRIREEKVDFMDEKLYERVAHMDDYR